MDAKTTLKARLPSRHVTEGPERAPHRSYGFAIVAPVELGNVFKRTPNFAVLKPRGRDVAKDMFETVIRLASRLLSKAGTAMNLKGNFALAIVDVARRPRLRAMRISSVLASAAVIGLAFGVEPSRSLDGRPSPNALDASASAAAPSPGDAYRTASEALKTGQKAQALISLQYAAEHGHGFALWQLGRMYADGDGVKRDDYRAFEYFQKFADSHADDNPAMPRARFVADAFVALGQYYLEGIPDTPVAASPETARRMFAHAASYFGDPEAQYQLAMLYVDGNGVVRDPKRAVPWLVLAANKGHYKSQAMLGRILFNGEHGLRQRASGLMWLTIACDGPGAKVPWISQLRETAVAQASDDERAMAYILLKRWVQGRHE